MSKAVSSVARSVTNVVKGAVSAVTKITSSAAGAIKDVAKSKLGKAVLIAAAVYFGGAALSGAFGGAAGGATGWAGAQAGVSGAASSLSTAWGQALAGNFSQAGSSLGTGFSGNVAGGNASTAMSGLDVGGMGSSPSNMGSMTSSGAASPVASGAGSAGAGVGTGTGAGGMSVGQGLMGAAKIQAGTALIGGVMQGKAAQDQRDAELAQASAGRDRYNANVGTTWWNAPQQAAAPSSAFAVDSTTAAAQNAGLINRSAAEPTYKKYYNA